MSSKSGATMLQSQILKKELEHIQIRKHVKPDDDRDIGPVLSYLNTRIKELDDLT